MNDIMVYKAKDLLFNPIFVGFKIVIPNDMSCIYCNIYYDQ